MLRQESAPLTDPLQMYRLFAGGTGNLYQFFFEDEVNLDRVDLTLAIYILCRVRAGLNCALS